MYLFWGVLLMVLGMFSFFAALDSLVSLSVVVCECIF